VAPSPAFGRKDSRISTGCRLPRQDQKADIKVQKKMPGAKEDLAYWGKRDEGIGKDSSRDLVRGRGGYRFSRGTSLRGWGERDWEKKKFKKRSREGLNRGKKKETYDRTALPREITFKEGVRRWRRFKWSLISKGRKKTQKSLRTSKPAGDEENGIGSFLYSLFGKTTRRAATTLWCRTEEWERVAPSVPEETTHISARYAT